MSNTSKTELLKRIGKADDMKENSLFIRVGTSTLYDYNRGVRATLKEIAFLSGNGNKIPDGSPYTDYVGWCWASQDYLSGRVGCSEHQINLDITRFVADGVIETRDWTDKFGHYHLEYRVKEDVVDANQRIEGQERKRQTSRVYKANKGSFTNENQPRRGHDGITMKIIPAKSTPRTETPHTEKPYVEPYDISAVTHMTSQPSPYDISAVSRVTSQPSATAEIAVKGVGFVRDLGGGLGSTSSSSPSLRSGSEERPPHQDQKQKQNLMGLGLGSKARTTPTPPEPFVCDECLGEDGVHHKTCSRKPRLLSRAAMFAAEGD
jgi:hypothetical protein